MRLKDKRIYVADDDVQVLEVLSIVLEEEGARVVRCTDGEKIFTSATLGKPDCIITDLYMPNSDGFEAIDAMKHLLSMPCPILVLTGYPTEENISRALELGASKCLSKPLTAGELVDTVTSLIDSFDNNSEGLINQFDAI